MGINANLSILILTGIFKCLPMLAKLSVLYALGCYYVQVSMQMLLYLLFLLFFNYFLFYTLFSHFLYQSLFF